jgi:hypothetical protein
MTTRVVLEEEWKRIERKAHGEKFGPHQSHIVIIVISRSESQFQC